MNIDKNQVLELLRSQGQHDQAAQADRLLPAKIDTKPKMTTRPGRRPSNGLINGVL